MRACSALLAVCAVAAAKPVTTEAPLGVPWKKDAVLIEGRRGAGAVFPYIDGLTPATLPRFVDRIADGRQAVAAARLFVAGPLIRTKAQGQRMIDAAAKLAKALQHGAPRLTKHRPAVFAPTSTKVKGGWDVSLVAYELDRRLAIVHVEARVTEAGAVTLKRKPVFLGPKTSWKLTDIPEGEPEAVQRVDAAMRQELATARQTLGRALAAPRDLDTAWALARTAPAIRRAQEIWGKAEEEVGSGLRIRMFHLADGTAVVFGAGGWEVTCSYVRHTTRDRNWRTLHRLYSFTR